MKKISTVALVLLVISLFVVPNALCKTTHLTIGTSNIGGSWYPFGGGMSSIIMKYVPNVQASASASAASVENVRLIVEDVLDMGIVMPDVAYYGANGTGVFEGKKPAPIKGMFSMWGAPMQMFVRAESDIYKFEDMKGKKVGRGIPGSGSELMFAKLLKLHGMTYDDINEQGLSTSEGIQALKDKVIDIFCHVPTFPSAACVELTTMVKCRMIPLAPEKAEEFVKLYPFYGMKVLPKGVYKGIDVDTLAVDWMGILICHENIDEEIVYKIVKACAKDNLDELKKCHSLGKTLSTEGMFKGVPIEWHPGAARFWREEGLLK
ncbi:MAG: TAXI family TRAP transporter solute-binding subunit [Deltaproteobacteria bacterium]|nr:TAXI family TRAP transporter solute-binding subunit [Deltaproteobacteria bacterium]